MGLSSNATMLASGGSHVVLAFHALALLFASERKLIRRSRCRRVLQPDRAARPPREGPTLSALARVPERVAVHDEVLLRSTSRRR